MTATSVVGGAMDAVEDNEDNDAVLLLLMSLLISNFNAFISGLDGT